MSIGLRNMWRRLRSVVMRCGWAFGLVLGLGLVAGASGQATLEPLAWPDLDLRIAGRVFAVAHQPDGGIVFGGTFSRVNGVPRGNLARLLPTGELDPDWDPTVFGSVLALAVDAEGHVYVGGNFSRIGGLDRFAIAKLSGTGAGEIDPDWTPSFASVVSAIVPAPDGSVYVGGSFGSANPLAHRSLARVSSEGIVDPMWKPRAEGWVRALALDANGDLYVGGSFETLGGLQRIGIGKVSGAGVGAVDPSWNPGLEGAVHALLLTQDDGILVGGTFGEIGGQPRSHLAKLDRHGQGDADPAWNGSTDGAVKSLALDASGRVHVGGDFARVNNVSRPHLARFDMAGSDQLDAHWNPAPNREVSAIAHSSTTGLAIGGEFSSLNSALRTGLAMLDEAGDLHPVPSDAEYQGVVLAMATQPNGGLIIGGDFVRADGLERRGLLRIAPEGTIDPEWDPAPDGFVYSLATFGNEFVFAAGEFPDSLGGASRHALKIAGQGTGVIDPTWTAGTDDVVEHVALDSAGDVYLAGEFRNVDGLARHGLAKLGGSGSGALLEWNPDPDGRIAALAIDGIESVFVAGAFSTFGGVPSPGIAKLSAQGSGTLDASWWPGPVSGIRVLELGEDDSLLVGGKFFQFAGEERYGVAKVSRRSGDVDPLWHPGTPGVVYAIEADGRGNVFLGGGFSWIGSVEQTALAKASAHGDGRVDASWRPDITGSVDTLATSPQGIVHAGGFLWGVSQLPRKSLVSYQSSYSLDYSSGGFGTIQGPASQTVFHGGDGAPVMAIPRLGFRFDAWSDGSTDNPRVEVEVTSAVDVAARFVARDDVADLRVSVTNDRDVLVEGEPVTYVVVVSNAGPNAVASVRVRGTVASALVNPVWRCLDGASGDPCSIPAQGTGAIDTIATLDVEEVIRFEVRAMVADSPDDIARYTSAVDAPDDMMELVPADNTASDSDTIVASRLHQNGFEPTVSP
jgi:uncharacterized repeat protein (TIGR01451 family)